MSLRKIEPEMVRYLDLKLQLNGMAQHAISVKDARTVFGLAMEACVGIVEVGGNNMGPMVKLIQETIDGANKEPWCMALVQTCLAYAELKTGIASPVFATEHCMTCLRETAQDARVKRSPLKYAIVIWQHSGTDNGHTGILIEPRQVTMRTVEGNTGSNGGRDGDGVYVKERSRTRNGDLIVRGFLKPFPPFVEEQF